MSAQVPDNSAARQVTMVLRECAICQSSIFPAEETTTCDKCGLTFHSECWQENLGCAAYGCEQVNALAPKEESPAPEQAMQQPIVEAIEPLPWSFLLLGAATIALMLSSLTYGVPSVLVGMASTYRLWKKKHLRDRPLDWAIGLSLLGALAGLSLSRIWWGRDYTGPA